MTKLAPWQRGDQPIMFSDLYSVSPIANKTMSSKLAKDKATKGFCIGFGLPFITVTMEGGGDFKYLGPMLLFSTAFGAMIGLGSGIFGAAQGTLYPDIIESQSVTGSKSSKIKSHHNVGGLPKKMNLKLIEPLKEFFKDEVRVLGKAIGLKSVIRNKHPFPGPGLAIRIIGNITSQKIKVLQEADNIYINELIKHGLYNKIWQAYAGLLSMKTVGVMGDSRTYEYTCLLRAVVSEDGMTADYFSFPKDFLDEISNKIVNGVPGINRVVYDITSKPPSTIELE